MKNVKLFSIRFCKLDEFPICFLPFSFENLEKFIISFPRAKFHSSFIDEFFNFINKHSTIKKLSITNICRSDVVDWSRLAESLPLLVEITLSTCWFSTDEAIELLYKFEMLKKFQFKLSDEYDILRRSLDRNWEGTYKAVEKSVVLRKI